MAYQVLPVLWGMGNPLLYGFNCESPDRVNISRVSLVDVAPCESPIVDPPVLNQSVQVLQVKNLEFIFAYSCGIRIKKYIFRCGMWSHISHVQHSEFVKLLTKEECLRAHTFGELRLYGQMVFNLIRNGTTNTVIQAAGSYGPDGTCENAAHFSDEGESFSHVVVEVTAQIILSSYTAMLDVSGEFVMLRNSLKCPYRQSGCNDVFELQTFWETTPVIDTCKETSFDVLFEGIGSLISSTDVMTQQNNTWLVVQQPDALFAVRLLDTLIKCNTHMYKTEHAGIYIVVQEVPRFYFKKVKGQVLSPDLVAFFNSKLQFLEYSTKKSLQAMHKYSLMRRCELERALLVQKLALVRSNPETAATLFSGDTPGGTYSITKGEEILIFSCPLVPVTYKPTNSCYDGLSVIYNNETYFLSPVSRILHRHAKEVVCSPMAPMVFKLSENNWIALAPDARITKAPEILRPTPELSLHFESISNVATNGLYTIADLKSLTDAIRYPRMRDAISESISRRVAGLNSHVGFDATRLFSEQDLHKLTESTLHKLWKGISVFGLWSSFFIGIVFIVQAVKYVFSTLLNALSLYQVTGLSFALLAAFWSSLTNFCLSRKLHQAVQTVSTPPPPDAPPPPPPQPGKGLLCSHMYDVPSTSNVLDSPTSVSSPPPPSYDSGSQVTYVSHTMYPPLSNQQSQSEYIEMRPRHIYNVPDSIQPSNPFTESSGHASSEPEPQHSSDTAVIVAPPPTQANQSEHVSKSII